MSIFTKLVEKECACDLCGERLIALYGNGWDNDRLYCSGKECGAEYVFPTTTFIDKLEQGEKCLNECLKTTEMSKREIVREFLDSVNETDQLSTRDMQFLSKFADIYFVE